MSLCVYQCYKQGATLESLIAVELAAEEDMFHGAELVKAALPGCFALQYLGTFEDMVSVLHRRVSLSPPGGGPISVCSSGKKSAVAAAMAISDLEIIA